MLIFLLKYRSYLVFSTFPENPDMFGVQSALKHLKIDEISRKKIENLILELPFGVGFIKIHEFAQF